ncbi:MAG: universal stress protein [Alphaproteobacteria bacterium]
MKTILVPVEESSVLPSMLETALLAARRFDSYIEGLHVRPALPGVVAAGAAGLVAATPDLVESFERQDRERTERARQLFREFMGAKNVQEAGGPGPATKPCWGWLEEVSPGDDAVGSRGRLFDLIVVGRPVRGQTTPAMSTLEAALFESGRPLLIAPPNMPAAIGNTVVVAWNCSTETARTIAFAMPFLLRARKVIVLTVEGVTVPGPSGADVAKNLVRNGVPAESQEAVAGGRGPGEAILAEAAARGCDLLIKGAYTHSRLRQMIFGGATNHILAATEIPVFMAH